MKVVLLGCSAGKINRPSPAVDLYNGPLYRKRLILARRYGGPHWILSAKHGLVTPLMVIAPYDKTLYRMRKAERDEWSSQVADKLLQYTQPGDELVVLAGKYYYEGWQELLELEGRSVEVPVRGNLFEQVRQLPRIRT